MTTLKTMNIFMVFFQMADFSQQQHLFAAGAGGTHSPPAMPHYLQYLTARLIQNGPQGLEIG